jgi:serine/threonine protein phosphatase 1
LFQGADHAGGIRAVPVRRRRVTLGDYVDRGPDSCAVLDWLIDYRGKRRLVALCGNHELMMLAAQKDSEALREWLVCGGDAALAAYSHFSDGGQLADIPDTHWEFLKNGTRGWYETKTHFFVHANVYPDCSLEEQPDFMLYWEPFDNPPPHQSGKVMVCGHTPQKSGKPLSVGHAICIDTGACKGGWLTCLDVGSGQYWQANQAGETRLNWLA